MKLFGCTAAVSEGRRSEVLDALVARLEAVEGARSLELLADPDQNRSLLTFAAPRRAIEEAAFVLASGAVEVIDLTCHQGEHPRLGSIDELAFFPIGETSLEDCVRVARDCGERIARELAVPVYFAEEAATRSELRRASALRRIQFEGLREHAAGGDEGSIPPPDCAAGAGPHPAAGVLVVLARAPHCHLDVVLETSDLALGRRIADEVRNLEITPSGARSVSACVFRRDEEQALEIVTRVLDPARVGLPRVVRVIEELAREAGVGLRGASLTGLVPQSAVVEEVLRELPLDGFDPQAQVLERRLAPVG